MQWLLQVAGFYFPIISDNGVNELVLQLQPTRDGADLDGSTFKCVATTTNGTRYEQSITVCVKGTPMYLVHCKPAKRLLELTEVLKYFIKVYDCIKRTLPRLST